MNAASRWTGRGGFTLIELLVSLGVATIVLSALGSVMVLALVAIPEPKDPAEGLLRGAALLDRLDGDLSCAISIVEASATAIEFDVPDRNGDNVAERIRYEWSGTVGQPLVRVYNGGGPVTIVENVQELVFGYDGPTTTTPGDTQLVAGPEVELSAYESFVTSTRVIDKSSWTGMYFVPSLPADAVEWSVTRVRILVQADGGKNEITGVQLRPADANGLPTGVILEEAQLLESLLGDTPAWAEVTFGAVSGLTPGQGLCLVLATTGKPSARVWRQVPAAKVGTSAMLTSGDGGATWVSTLSGALGYEISGKVYTESAGPDVTVMTVQRVTVQLRVGSADAPALVAAIPMLNRPTREVGS